MVDLASKKAFKPLKWWVLVLSLTVTGVVWVQQYRSQRHNAEVQFGYEIQRIQDAVRNQIDRYETVLRFSRSFLVQRPDIPHELWVRYVQAIDLHGRYAGISTLSFVTKVQYDDLPRLEQSLRSHLKHGLLFEPRPGKTEYYVKTHTEPLSEDWEALGQDLSREPQLRETADRSIDTGKPTLTPLLAPLIKQERGLDLALFYPIYDSTAVPEDLILRRQSSIGWVMARFNSADMVTEALKTMPHQIHFEIFDGMAQDPDKLVFDSDAQLVPPGGDPNATFSKMVTMDVGGRPWSLLFMTTDVFDVQTLKGQHLIFLATGLALSLALFYAARLLTDAREQALKAAEQMSSAYQQSEERIHMIADSVPALISYIDDQRIYRFANREYTLWFGKGPDEMVGKTVAEVMGEGTYNNLKSHIDRVLAGEQVSFENDVLTVDGEIRHLQATLVPHRHGDAVIGYFVLGEDMTQRNLYERQRQALVSDLERSNSELEQFAYVASHDLQEPLRMVSSYMQLIKRKYGKKLDGDAEEFIDYAVEGAQRMQVMITDLLGYSRVGTRGRDPEPVALDEPLDNALKNLKAGLLDSGATVNRTPLPTVMADEPQIARLLQNLIGNALKYRAPDRKPEITVGAELVDGMWQVSITDNGIGIAPEHAERIFLIFQRLHTHDKYEGTGIGLAVCKKIIERHGGHIWVEGRPGEGSSFYFTLQPPPENI